MIEEVKELAQYGSTGIAIALVIYSAYKDRILNKTLQDFSVLVSNHLEHETDAKIKLAESITLLTERIKKHFN